MSSRSHGARIEPAPSAPLFVPSDADDLPQAIDVICLYICVAGALHYRDAAGNEVTAPHVAVGEFPVQVRKVFDTGTDAEGLVLYAKAHYFE